MSCSDPHWTAYVSAIGTPVVAMLAAIIAGLITWGQWKTARDRLKLDLFDKRLVIYQVARDFLASVMTSGKVNEKELFKFSMAMREAKWLLNADVAQYLNETLRNKAIYLQVLDQELPTISPGAERTRNVHRQSEIKKWINAQYDVLDKKFASFLQLQH